MTPSPMLATQLEKVQVFVLPVCPSLRLFEFVGIGPDLVVAEELLVPKTVFLAVVLVRPLPALERFELRELLCHRADV